MFGSKTSSIPQWNNNKTTEANDVYCENGPEDTITGIRFSNTPNIDHDPQFVSTSSWDSTVKVWEVNKSYQGLGAKYQGENNMDHAVLGHCWSPDNSVIFGACADNTVKMWDLKANSVQKLGEHSSCVKDVMFCEKNNILISASWDGHLKFWDMKSPGAIFDISFEPFKIWSFSYVYPLMVGALSDNSIFVMNMESITSRGSSKPELVSPSPLKFQTRHVEVFPTALGYAVTSIEGRCGVKNINFNDLKDKYNEDFNFKCHRKQDTANNVYPVHQTSFNARYMTFMTAGGDGNYYIWDKDKRKRLKSTQGCDAPITACRMALNGEMLAYSFGYDWAKGCNGAGSCPTGMFLHPTNEKEIKSSS